MTPPVRAGEPPTLPAPDVALLEGLFSSEVRTAWGAAEHAVEDLAVPERGGLERAVPSRQREFATGRVLARGLLDTLGHPGFPLCRDEERLPVWPPGIVGSISHSNGLCAVAVSGDPRIRGLGLDVEPDAPVDLRLEARIAVAAERRWLAASAEAERGRRGRLLFSAKEAVYKAFFPRLRQRWGFHDVALEIDLEAGRLRARLPKRAGRASVDGRLARRAGWLVVAVEDR